MKVHDNYMDNVSFLEKTLGFGKSYDILERNLTFNGRKVTFLFIDGFVKDENLQSLISNLSIYKKEELAKAKTAKEIIETSISAIETSEETDLQDIVKLILSGQTAMIIENIKEIIMLDLRTYPARGPEEPDKEKVIHGPRDGFVETIVFNTALIRRRIRDPKLRFEMLTIGTESKTDVAVAYIEGRAKSKALQIVKKHLNEIEVDSLTLGDQSLVECINKKSWYNPLPKVRYTERPDITASHILEGKIVVFVDNNPSAILMPTCIFDFLQDVGDYYSPILTGNYLRFIRNFILLTTIFLTPLYMLVIEHRDEVPEYLMFLLPQDEFHVPIVLQLILLEFAIDGLRLASLNTPSALGMSLSVIGAIVLGEYSVTTGWFIPQTVFYMAIVALVSFTQQSIELSYAVKYFRMFILICTYFFKIWGLVAATILCIIMTACTKTFTGEPYLYPLIPFHGKALLNLLFRTPIKSKIKN